MKTWGILPYVVSSWVLSPIGKVLWSWLRWLPGLLLGYLTAERVNHYHLVLEVKDYLCVPTSLEEVMGVSPRKQDLKRLQVKSLLRSWRG